MALSTGPDGEASPSGEGRGLSGPWKEGALWLAGLCLSRLLCQTITMTYPAVLPLVQREWRMSGAEAGSISSAFQIGHGVSLWILSSLADRVGSRAVYLGAMSATAVFSLAFALFAEGYLSALILYTLVAVAMGGTYTTALMLLAARYPSARRGMASGFFIASSSLGHFFSLLLCGASLSTGGYRLAFLLSAGGPLLAALVSWVTLRRTRVPLLARKEGMRFKKEVLGNREARLLILGYSMHTWELLAMWCWTPAFLTASLALGGVPGPLAAGGGAFWSGALHLSGLAASSTMGLLSDRLGRARVILLLSAGSTACSFLFGWSVDWPFYAVILLGLLYAFTSLGDSPVLSAALTEVVTPSYLGAAFGLRSLLGFGTGAVSPLLFGLVLDWTNPGSQATGHYTRWGPAFCTLGVAGFAAVWAARRLSLPGRCRGPQGPEAPDIPGPQQRQPLTKRGFNP